MLISGRKGLRVCSRALARASPVFKALLSPCFKEGTELKTDGVVRVDLPEDAYEALRTVCLGLHFCHDQIKFDIPLKDLVDVARLADKYDLGRALRPVTELWITKHLEGVADTDYRMLLTAAYLLQHDRMFNKVGNSMVWDGFSDSFDAAFGEDCHDSSDLLALFGISCSSQVFGRNTDRFRSAVRAAEESHNRDSLSH